MRPPSPSCKPPESPSGRRHHSSWPPPVRGGLNRACSASTIPIQAALPASLGCHRGGGLPLPELAGFLTRQALARLPGDRENLAAVMALVRNEVREDVTHIQRQVAPHVPLGRRDLALGLEPQFQDGLDAVAAAL